jgi:formylglycine-generating enzyme required for sulfatase activity
MVSIPAGSFQMGSPAGEAGRYEDEGPQRRVSVPSFAAGKYEVTWTEYGACVSAGACPGAKDDGFGKGSRPVTNVSWDDAKKYASWLSSRTGKTYRLLSEAEWEYAARAGNQARWSFGDSESSLGSYAWYSPNSGGATHPVGSKTANAFGLFDMHGNVWEWVEDCYAESYSAGQPSDGRAFTQGNCSYRVGRGGSWLSDPRYLRSADRDRIDPAIRGNGLGFRVARTL